MRRVFFALWPGEAERQALAQAVHEACTGSGGRPVPAASLHATLAFLGSVPEAHLGQLSHVGREVASGFFGAARPPPLLLASFVHWAKPQVLAVLAREELRFHALAARLREMSAAAGFRPDLKPFHAHVTVARKVLRNRAAAHALQPVSWRCDAFALIDSRTEAAGPVYSVIESYSLVKDENAHGQ